MLGAGKTQVATAEALGVSDRTIRNWAKAKSFQTALRRAREQAARQAARAAGKERTRANRNAWRRYRRRNPHLLERAVRRQAREQAAVERARHAEAASRLARPRRRRSPYEAWLDEHDARLPLRRADLHSRADELAARAVAAGGGTEAVLEATGLRTRENVLRLIDPAILVRAHDSEAAASAAAEPERGRLRRLVPDRELVRRRAAGETLRLLARDYGVSHTTLSRYFARPEVARELRAVRRRLPAP